MKKLSISINNEDSSISEGFVPVLGTVDTNVMADMLIIERIRFINILKSMNKYSAKWAAELFINHLQNEFNKGNVPFTLDNYLMILNEEIGNISFCKDCNELLDEEDHIL